MGDAPFWIRTLAGGCGTCSRAAAGAAWTWGGPFRVGRPERDLREEQPHADAGRGRDLVAARARSGRLSGAEPEEPSEHRARHGLRQRGAAVAGESDVAEELEVGRGGPAQSGRGLRGL